MRAVIDTNVLLSALLSAVDFLDQLPGAVLQWRESQIHSNFAQRQNYRLKTAQPSEFLY
jgi:predicted nucleic acid-binding protein